jgi:hypothetical protein
MAQYQTDCVISAQRKISIGIRLRTLGRFSLLSTLGLWGRFAQAHKFGASAPNFLYSAFVVQPQTEARAYGYSKEYAFEYQATGQGF